VTEPGLVVYRFDAPLFFINAEHFHKRLEQVLVESPADAEWLVIDFEGIGSVDATAIGVLVELLQRLAELGVSTVVVARANDHVLSRLQRAELLEPAGTSACSQPSTAR